MPGSTEGRGRAEYLSQKRHSPHFLGVGMPGLQQLSGSRIPSASPALVLKPGLMRSCDFWRVWGLGFGVWGLGFRVEGVRFRVGKVGMRGANHMLEALEATKATRRTRTTGFGVQGLGFRV